MSDNFLSRHSVGRLLIKTSGQYFSGLGGNKARIFYNIRGITDGLRYDELICSPKIKFPKKHLMIHNSDRPNIDSYGIRISWVKFWAHVRWSTDIAGESIFSGGESKIPYLTNSILEKYIIRFDISVNDSSFMAIVESRYYLEKILHCLSLR